MAAAVDGVAASALAKLNPFAGEGLGGRAGAVRGPGGVNPNLQHGGEVRSTGWAMVHKGEVYSGVGRGLGGSIYAPITIHAGAGSDPAAIARQVREEFLKIGRRNPGIFGGLG